MSVARSLSVPHTGCFAVLLFVLGRSLAEAAEATDPIELPRAVALTADEEDSLRIGWIERFEVVGSDVHDYRIARLPALFVPQGSPATTLVPPGAFRLTLSGWLDTELPGRCAFRVLGRGVVSMKINGVTLIDHLEMDTHQSTAAQWALLPGGMNRIEVVYRSPANGDAQLRLLWQGDTFREEPLPPDRLFHNSNDSALQASNQLRLGRELIAELHCLRCHVNEPSSNVIQAPELQRTAPQLTAAGERFEPTWLFHWILDPHALRDDARMPQLLVGIAPSDRRQAAADIVALLTPVQQRADEVKRAASDEGAVERGRHHFESLGCVSCHRLTGPREDDPYQRISLALAAQKYRPGRLAAYLEDPQREDPWRKMPNFALTVEEAQNLEYFLRTTAQVALPSAPELATANAARGAVWFTKLGCAGCHGKLEGAQPDATTPAGLGPSLEAREYTNGCLADDSASVGKSPRFRLTPSEMLALRRFVATGMAALERNNAAETAERMIRQLRCNHCHARDDTASVWPEVMAEEGSEGTLPETVPSLTWTGEKLQVASTRRVLSGDVAARARPWLQARMPSFPAYANTIALGLARQHGFSAAPRLGPASPRGHVELGKRLTGREEGFFCTECHAVGARPAVGAFSHHGVNFDQVGRRLNYDYFQRWITSPARVDPGTKMPIFSPDGQQTTKTQILDGRAQAQFEAIWHYLRSLSREDTDGRNAQAAGTRTYDRSDSAANRRAE